MIQDFLPEIFCIHEEFAAGGECVFIAVAPLIRKEISWGAVLLSWYTTYV
jgi:hypothetical protein